VIKNVEFDFDVGDDHPFPEFKLPPKTSKLRALILTPTRELAIQVKNHIVAIAKYTGIQVNFSF
jgi:superfamily II DNA/RNA helicase